MVVPSYTLINWKTCTIGFSSAFIQEALLDPVWIHLLAVWIPHCLSRATPPASRSCIDLWLCQVIGPCSCQRFYVKKALRPALMTPVYSSKDNLVVIFYIDD